MSVSGIWMKWRHQLATVFTLEDFQRQMLQIRKLGPMREIMQMIPGVGKLLDSNPELEDPENDLRRIDGIINSMTPAERVHPERIDRSRRNRIARGSGVAAKEVTNLLKQFQQMSGLL